MLYSKVEMAGAIAGPYFLSWAFWVNIRFRCRDLQGPKRNGSSVFTYNGQLYLVGGESSRESSNDEVLMKYNDATAR